MSAFNSQVGGSHYKDMVIQPAEYAEKNKLSYLEGAAVKYISRHKSKNGLQDLLKAKHCIDLLIDLHYDGGRKGKSGTTTHAVGQVVG